MSGPNFSQLPSIKIGNFALNFKDLDACVRTEGKLAGVRRTLSKIKLGLLTGHWMIQVERL